LSLHNITSSGFSLIDLTVAIALTSLLFSLSMLSVHAISDRREIKAEAQKLMRSLELAVFQSLNSEIETSLTVLSSGYELERKVGTSIRYELPPNIWINQKDRKRRINFSKSGVASPATIQLVKGDTTCEVTLSLRGRVRSSC
jgi:hypothetical protein